MDGNIVINVWIFVALMILWATTIVIAFKMGLDTGIDKKRADHAMQNNAPLEESTSTSAHKKKRKVRAA